MNALSEKGFTVLELLTTIVIASILVAIAVPSFSKMIEKNKVVAATNEIVGLIELAKNKAKSSNKSTAAVLCEKVGATDCSVGVTYLENIDDGSSIDFIRSMRKDSDVLVLLSGETTKGVAFEPNGTISTHTAADSSAKFKDDGSYDATSVSNTSGFRYSNTNDWLVKKGDTCRLISISSSGNIRTVKTDGGCYLGGD